MNEPRHRCFHMSHERSVKTSTCSFSPNPSPAEQLQETSGYFLNDHRWNSLLLDDGIKVLLHFQSLFQLLSYTNGPNERSSTCPSPSAATEQRLHAGLVWSVWTEPWSVSIWAQLKSAIAQANFGADRSWREPQPHSRSVQRNLQLSQTWFESI